jgi:hypothetical protein
VAKRGVRNSPLRRRTQACVSATAQTAELSFAEAKRPSLESALLSYALEALVLRQGKPANAGAGAVLNQEGFAVDTIIRSLAEPVAYESGFEVREEDEMATGTGLVESLRSISETTFRDDCRREV